MLTKSSTVGLSIAKYGKLAHSVTESSRYFKEQLLLPVNIPSSSEPHDRLPFSIPFFLKTIVGDRCRYGAPCKGMLDLTFTACETSVSHSDMMKIR